MGQQLCDPISWVLAVILAPDATAAHEAQLYCRATRSVSQHGLALGFASLPPAHCDEQRATQGRRTASPISVEQRR